MSIALTQVAPRSEGRDLALRHRYGDPEAFEEIYQRFEQMVFGLALRMSGDREEAADLTQETFLRVFRHLGGFRGRSSLKTWVYRITLNCCRSKLRRRSRRPSQEPPEHLEELADHRADPEERTLSHDLGRQLAAAIASLPLAFREAVVLRDVQGLSYGEIGDVLGLRIGTVRSRIARGRERLRGLLEDSA
jgi:RNA polymerase sigma-70 factor (ECF subfamily)